MSAFLCDDSHINFILTFAETDTYGSVWVPSIRQRVTISDEIRDNYTRQTNGDFIGQILVNENYRSLATRYGDNDAPHEFKFKRHRRIVNRTCNLEMIVQVLKACDCYDYQACETLDYDQTDAANIIRNIRSAAISKLPGYSDAKWGAPLERGAAA